MSFAQIQLRRDTPTNWGSLNPTLLQGEFGLETTSGAIKIGDGATAWNTLAYYSTKIRVAAGTPATSLGVVGDVYINTTTSDLYLKTGTSTWTPQSNLQGIQGTQGIQGNPGVVQDLTSSDAVAFSVAGTAHLTIDSPTMAAHTYKGNNTGSAAKPANLTNVQVTADLVAATIALQGMMSANDKKKLNTIVYDVANDFGGDGTGTTDSITALNSAVAAAQTAGFLGGSAGIIWLGACRFKQSASLIVTGHNITIGGTGGGSSLDSGNYYAGMGATLAPTGAFPAVIVRPVTTNGLSGQPNIGFKWKGVGVDGYASSATIGLQMISTADFDVDDFYSINCTDAALDFNTLPAATLTVAAAFPLSAATLTVNSTAASGSGSAFPSTGSIIVRDGSGTPRLVTYTGTTGTTFTGASSGGLGSGTAAITTAVQILPVAQDTTRGVVGQVNIRALDGGATSGIGIRMNGDLGGLANTNLIHFNGSVKIAHLNGIGIKDINSDTNTFDLVIINRASGGTGIGAEIGAGAANTFASRNNLFGHASFGAGGLTCRGTPTNTFPSQPTIVMNYQLANGEVLPTVEAGAILDVRNYNGAFKLGQLTPPLLTAQALTAATLNKINNTQFTIPPQGWLQGARLHWSIPINKTGTVGLSWIAQVRTNTTGTAGSGGTVLATVTYTATAVADGGVLEIDLICSALGSGTAGAVTGYFNLSHNLAATGLATGVTAPVSDATAASGKVYTRPTFTGFDTTLPATGVPQFIFVEINPVTAATVMNAEPGVQAFCLAQANV